MTLDEAKTILIENRPDRPHGTERRRLQAAIDTVLDELEKGRATECQDTFTS